MSTEPTFAQKACERYEEIFKAEGFAIVTKTQEGDDYILLIKAEGRGYVFVFDEADKGFIRFIYPNFWDIENPEEYGRALEAASEVNRRCKFVKIHLSEDKSDTTAALEIFDKDDSTDKKTILRLLTALTSGVNMFRTEMQKTMK